MKSGLYYTHPACLRHDPRELSPAHPDTPERLITLERRMAEHDWLGWERLQAPAASEAQLELAHTRRHVEAIRDLCLSGGGEVDADTFVGEASWEAALHAAGGALAMTETLIGGQAAVGFCAVRPSGHHAESDRAMGFCLLNNVAVAAAGAIALHGLRRVLVVDWDVHHGNGTAEIFRSRSDVLMVSIHQERLYPGTGPLGDSGTGEGEGYTLNLPVPAGSREGLWLGLLDRVVVPAAREFAPELVLVSAGFDAHERDPLAECNLTTGSFAQMAIRVRDLAAELGAPVGVVMEGGYDREVLADCVLATLPALAGAGEATAARPQDEPGAQERIEMALTVARRRWAV